MDLADVTMFPDGFNVEFASIQNRREIRMRVWERGSQETLSCGSGACAVFAVAFGLGLVDAAVTVHLPGGDLEVSTLDGGETVFLKGPAQMVFEGDFFI